MVAAAAAVANRVRHLNGVVEIHTLFRTIYTQTAHCQCNYDGVGMLHRLRALLITQLLAVSCQRRQK